MHRIVVAAALLALIPAAARAQAAAGVGGMGGSTLAQVIFGLFAGPALNAASKGVVANVLHIVAAYVTPIISLTTVLVAKRALYNAISIDELVSRMVRTMLVLALCTPAVFNARVSQAVLVDIPAQIAATGTGVVAAPQDVAKNWDGIYNRVANVSARLRAQATGWQYMITQGVIWLGEIICYGFITLSLMAFLCSAVASAFMLPMVALTLPLLCFDATTPWALGAIGKQLALFAVMAVSVWLGAFVAHQIVAYMVDYVQMVTASPPSDTFRMNAGANQGDALFSSLGITGGAGEPMMPPPTAGDTTATVNVTAGIQMILNLICVVMVGAFIQGIMVAMALAVFNGAGFSLRGPVNAATSVAQAAYHRATGKK